MRFISIRMIFLALSLSFLSFPVNALQIGDAVPACKVVKQNENEVLDFSQFSGKVILIDFWATWCPPCKKSMPFLDSLRNEFLHEGFEVVAINVDEDRADAVRFLKKYPVKYPIVFDSSGDCPSAFSVQAMPSSYFIGKKGKVRALHLGYRESQQQSIREQVIKLLGEKNGSKND